MIEIILIQILIKTLIEFEIIFLNGKIRLQNFIGDFMKAIIIGTTTCPYCVNAKSLATERGIPFEYLTIVKDEKEVGGNNISMDKAFELVGKPFRTVPQILVDDQHIGGFDDFSKFLRNKDVDTKDFSDMDL
jgi:glutaredoxin 1